MHTLRIGCIITADGEAREVVGCAASAQARPRSLLWRGLQALVASQALALTLLLGVHARPAAASVTIGPERIEVQGAGAGAVITRDPFRITFTGAHGETVGSRRLLTRAKARSRSNAA